MKNRFDLENEISTLMIFRDQLGDLNEGILEHSLPKDRIASAIEGIRVLMDLHYKKMMDTMCQCFKLDNYNSINSK